MQAFAAGLQSLGLRAGDRVSLFSENSSRWLVADQGIMFNGAADAVSGPVCFLTDTMQCRASVPLSNLDARASSDFRLRCSAPAPAASPPAHSLSCTLLPC